MIADLRPYPEYKDSGLPWLGQVPQHWQTERAKWLFTKMDRPVRDDDEVVTCFRDGMVTLRKNRRLRGFTEATVYSGYQGIRKGDLVIHGMDAFAGAIGVSDSDGKGTPVYNVCQPRPGVNARYYANLVREMSQSQWILALAKGIRERSTDFRFEMFGNQRVPLPPPEEQAAIVRFLDWASGRLDRAIRAKRKVIALLNEQKQAIIHRAVTRGLDPNVPLKPSGIPWLGDIPAHWEVRRLGRLAKVFNGTTPSRAQSSYWSNGTIPWLASGKVNDHIISTPSELITARALTECSLMIVPSGALLMGLIGQGRTRGMCALLGIDACISQNLAAIVPEPTLSSHFLYHVLVACYDDVRELGRGGNQAALNCEIVGRLPIPVPPPEEQVAIDQALTAEVSHLLPLERTIQREIELLREYRTRLVADVVTGKLDVRAAAAQLPEETPPDPVEDDVELDDALDAANEEADV